VYSRILAGTASELDTSKTLIYFPNVKSKGMASVSVRHIDADIASSAELGVDSLPALHHKEESESKKEIYVPNFIWLRIAVVYLDYFMRLGHLGIYGFVLLGRYVVIQKMAVDDTFSCANILSYFASPSTA